MIKTTNEDILTVYSEILDVFNSYLKAIPEAYKSMDLKIIEEIPEEQLHRTLINRLHWHVWSFSDSIIMMNTYRKYAEANMLLRYIFEATLLIQYLHEYPYEAKRWLEFQNFCLKIDENAKENYKNYMKMNHSKFKKFLLKNEYHKILPKIKSKNYNGAKTFSPEFLRKNVKHDKFFSDAPNDELTESANELYHIMSKYVHPSIAIVEYYKERDIEYELDILKLALNYFDIACKIFLNEFEDFISEEMKEEIQIHIFKSIKIFDERQYNELKELSRKYLN